MVDKYDAIIDVYNALKDNGFIWYCKQTITDNNVSQEVQKTNVGNVPSFLEYIQTFEFDGLVDNEVEYMYAIKRVHEDRHIIFNKVYKFHKDTTFIQIGIE